MRQGRLWASLGILVTIAMLGGLTLVFLRTRHMLKVGMQVPAQGQTVYRLDARHTLLIPLSLYPKARILDFRPIPTGNADEIELLLVLATRDDAERVKQYYLQHWRSYGVEERRSQIAAGTGVPGWLLATKSRAGSWASLDILRVAPDADRSPGDFWSSRPPQGDNAETQMVFQIPIVAVKRR